MGSLKDETIVKLTGKKTNPEDTIDGVEKEAKDMNVVRGAMNTARELAGAGTLEKQIDEANKRAAKAEEAQQKAIEDKHRAEIEKVESTLGAKIDSLAKSYTGGASKESIADQIAEIKKAATELNMGGSKVSELRDMMNLITTLNPQKTMVDQIRDAKELISAIVPQPGKTNEFSIGGMPAAIALELKKMDTNLQITLENMKDERQRKDQEFQLKIKEYDEARADRIQEAAAKIGVERERNQMISGGIKTLGGAIGQGLADGSREVAQPPGPIGARQTEPPKSYHIELNENEADEFNCPKCAAPIAVGPTTTVAQCVGCNSKFPVVRKPATQMPGPPPPEEED